MHLMQYRAIFILALHKRNDPSWVMADHSPIHDTKHSRTRMKIRIEHGFSKVLQKVEPL